MTKWIRDKWGNKCSDDYFGNLDEAQEALNSLRNCTNCTNCANCTNCSDCTWCRDCVACVGCRRCNHCRSCSNCTWCTHCYRCGDCVDCVTVVSVRHLKTTPAIIGPFRSDGWQFVLGKDGKVHAGCHVFDNIQDARDHWKQTRGDTRLGDETMLILDYLENVAALGDRKYFSKMYDLQHPSNVL